MSILVFTWAQHIHLWGFFETCTWMHCGRGINMFQNLSGVALPAISVYDQSNLHRKVAHTLVYHRSSAVLSVALTFFQEYNWNILSAHRPSWMSELVQLKFLDTTNSMSFKSHLSTTGHSSIRCWRELFDSAFTPIPNFDQSGVTVRSKEIRVPSRAKYKCLMTHRNIKLVSFWSDRHSHVSRVQDLSLWILNAMGQVSTLRNSFWMALLWWPNFKSCKSNIGLMRSCRERAVKDIQQSSSHLAGRECVTWRTISLPGNNLNIGNLASKYLPIAFPGATTLILICWSWSHPDMSRTLDACVLRP